VISVIGLKCERSSYGVGGTLELGQQCITPQFLNSTVVFPYSVTEVPKRILDTFVS
jgi:hypothetical protein